MKAKNIFNLISYNLKTLIEFEMFYKLISLFIFAPFFVNLFNLVMKATGFNRKHI
ncbi:MAG: hypothetical protein HUJ68_14230 [Clostridia bacterium]|nr:hypothetical protein [Clostridia bacterium]